ncbi:predicted protein [Nematostella vectensis]|uniref:G-protein coupled receptors family 1 profile domain-containing protein n=1 Tax=Nematostella vectensis TaxID=45351 RepID=A7SXY1_NEMVE|nr:predicted protein [Nematostella vectensis]|eukprot:XP_001623537.1 predicted protein [Nematostella vectensis]
MAVWKDRLYSFRIPLFCDRLRKPADERADRRKQVLFVVKPNLYRKYFKKSYAWGMVLAVWLGSVATVTVVMMIPLFKFTFRADRAICFAVFKSREVDAGFSVLTTFFYIIAPVTVMIISHWKIHKTVKVHNTQMANGGIQDNRHDTTQAGRDQTRAGRGQTRQVRSRGTQLRGEETRITKVLFVLVFGYILCMLPVSVVHYLDIFAPAILTRKAQMMYTYLYYLNNGIHPLIYGAVNKPFKVAFKRVFGCRLGRV